MGDPRLHPYITIRWRQILTHQTSGLWRQYSYSDIASVRYDGSGETTIYPNPATSKMTITTTGLAALQIMDVYGRLLTTQDILERKNIINITAFPSGIYQLGT